MRKGLLRETTYRSLDQKGKNIYIKKLRCVGLSLKDDPCLAANEAKFAGGMTTWL